MQYLAAVGGRGAAASGRDLLRAGENANISIEAQVLESNPILEVRWSKGHVP